jgi:hypothetical protein
MADFRIENAREQLISDSTGNYKSWLVKVLQNYKNDISKSKQQMLPPETYDRLIYLDHALDAAILTLLEYSNVKNKVPEKPQNTSFESIFR